MELAPALLANRRKPSSSAGDIPRGAIMSTSITHETATTKFAEADGVHYAYRRFGGPSDAPLVFCHRFRGTMDDWDPATINGFARERDVILFDNAGVGLSTGVVPNNARGMADHLIAFLGALGVSEVDLLGFSMGGYVAQLPCSNPSTCSDASFWPEPGREVANDMFRAGPTFAPSPAGLYLDLRSSFFFSSRLQRGVAPQGKPIGNV